MSKQDTTTSDAPVLRKTFTIPGNASEHFSFYLNVVEGGDDLPPSMLGTIQYLISSVAHGLDTITVSYKNAKIIGFELVTRQYHSCIDKIERNYKNLEINVLDSPESNSPDTPKDVRLLLSIKSIDYTAQPIPENTLSQLEQKLMQLNQEIHKKKEEAVSRFNRITTVLEGLKNATVNITRQENIFNELNGLETQLDGILVDGNINQAAIHVAYKKAKDINNYIYF